MHDPQGTFCHTHLTEEVVEAWRPHFSDAGFTAGAQWGKAGSMAASCHGSPPSLPFTPSIALRMKELLKWLWLSPSSMPIHSARPRARAPPILLAFGPGIRRGGHSLGVCRAQTTRPPGASPRYPATSPIPDLAAGPELLAGQGHAFPAPAPGAHEALAIE